MLPSVSIYFCIGYTELFFVVFSLDMFRDGEKHYLLAVKVQPMVDTYLYLAKVYLRLDQPLLAVSRLQEGLEKFPLVLFKYRESNCKHRSKIMPSVGKFISIESIT
jgi:hypothetical protein